ncbi:MAG: ATP-binding protein [Thermoanaerobaculia bacterium]
MTRRRAGNADAPPALDAAANAFRDLLHGVLLQASQGSPRAVFLRDLLRTLLEFSRSDRAALRFPEGERVFVCRLERGPDSEPRFELRAEEAGGRKARRRAGPAGEGRPSTLRLALSLGGEAAGELRLSREAGAPFTAEEVSLLRGIPETLSLALAHQRAQWALRERVKELTCLYGIARIAEQPGLAFDEVLQRIVGLLPSAWQYPDVTAAAITFDGHRQVNPGFRADAQRQSAAIVVRGELRGAVEVVYLEEKPDVHEGPFLAEERSLIDEVARQVGLWVERREGAEEKARLQSQLRHADRLATIGQLAAGVAHELNEPLGGILGFAQLARKSPGLPAQADADLEKIVKASLHAREIVRKLLIFARQMPAAKTNVDLNRVVTEGLYLVEARCATEGIRLERDLDPALAGIVADPGQLQQVLMNLVVNGIQAMSGGGKLTIRTRNRPGGIVLSVEDSGAGMDDETLREIFNPFFTMKEVGQGTGLGLSVVHGIVTSHGGTIRVESEPGRGSRFSVDLPLGTADET